MESLSNWLSLRDESITRTSEELAASLRLRHLLSSLATVVEACLGSMGAAVFCNSPTAGLFVLAATLVNFGFFNWRLWVILSAVAFANLFAAALELPLSQIRLGTYGSAAYLMAAFLVGAVGSAGECVSSARVLTLTLAPCGNALFVLLIALCVPITVVLSFSLGQSSRWPALALPSHIPCYAALVVLRDPMTVCSLI